MYNQEYYEKKKNKLQGSFINKMERTLVDLENLVFDFSQTKNKFQEDMAEVVGIIKENEEKPKAAEEPKAEKKAVGGEVAKEDVNKISAEDDNKS